MPAAPCPPTFTLVAATQHVTIGSITSLQQFQDQLKWEMSVPIFNNKGSAVMNPSEQRAVCLILGVLCVLLTSCQRPVGETPPEADETNTQVGVSTENVQSGLQTGEFVGAFQVVKVGGIDDGVQIDEQLCYR